MLRTAKHVSIALSKLHKVELFGTHVEYNTLYGGGNKAILTSNTGITTLNGYLSFRALPFGATGLMVELTMAEDNYPAVARTNRSLIAPGF